ncbi:hypothetical protein [Chitinibacter tainanensis]|uniref:hypothetical protein n=1 Tax=Chitinibacter tainanensis TaxID=230667 RepID=UPI00048BD9A1|nr:hypothetical protein [Chitinibacter tainanensis]
MENDVEIGLKNLPDVFSKVSVKFLLKNGNAERQLKFLSMSSLDDFAGFAYVMDKKFHGHEIDLLTFRGGEPHSAAEYKCTFSFDPGGTKKAAFDAIKKTTKTEGLEELNLQNIYIVHFLNHARHSANGDVPQSILEKYPNGKPISIVDLKKIYTNSKSELKVVLEQNVLCERGAELLDVLVLRLSKD